MTVHQTVGNVDSHAVGMVTVHQTVGNVDNHAGGMVTVHQTVGMTLTIMRVEHAKALTQLCKCVS